MTRHIHQEYLNVSTYFVEKFRVTVTDVLVDHAILAEAQQNGINTDVVAAMGIKK